MSLPPEHKCKTTLSSVFAGIATKFASPSAKTPLGNIVYLGQLLPNPKAVSKSRLSSHGLCRVPSPGLLPCLGMGGCRVCSALECGRGDGSCRPSLSPPSACPAWRGPSTPVAEKLLPPRAAGPRAAPFGELFWSSSPSPSKSNTRSMLFAEMNVQIKPEGEGLCCLPPRLARLLPAP